MAPNLNEVWLNEPSPERFREFVQIFDALTGKAQSLGLSSDLHLVAGTRLSIEEAKVMFNFDIADATTTLPAFGRLLAKKFLQKRRFTPIADWGEATKFVRDL